MELWASGFNAWNQLQFDGELPVEPRDVDAFRCVLRDDKDIEVLRTSLSATLVRTSPGLRVAGDLDNFSTLCVEKSSACINVAVAGNGKIAEFRSSIITQYDSHQIYLEGKGESLGEFEDILQLVANQTSFTALTKNGTVITWGDGRYETCLGREVNGDSLASVPSVVEDLLDLPTGPIKKISSGGFMTAALTASNDLYVWGGRPGESKVLEKFTGSPSPLDLDGHDVLDIAVGDNHVVALTTDRVLFLVGDNGNGQLGLGVAETNDWKQVLLPLKSGQRIMSVHAGYKNSFTVVENVT